MAVFIDWDELEDEYLEELDDDFDWDDPYFEDPTYEGWR